MFVVVGPLLPASTLLSQKCRLLLSILIVILSSGLFLICVELDYSSSYCEPLRCTNLVKLKIVRAELFRRRRRELTYARTDRRSNLMNSLYNYVYLTHSCWTNDSMDVVLGIRRFIAFPHQFRSYIHSCSISSGSYHKLMTHFHINIILKFISFFTSLLLQIHNCLAELMEFPA